MPDEATPATPFRLGEWEVHPEDGTLRLSSEVRRLEPLLMDLLVFLARRAGEVVSKQQLFDSVWGGRIVSDDALTGAVSQLRKALGDEARMPRYIETLPKRGYRLLMSVTPGVGGLRRDPPAAAARPARVRFRFAATVVALLGVVFAIAVARRPPSVAGRPPGPSALDAVDRGRALLDNPSEGSLEQARLDFARALEIDPRSADAEAGLARVYILQAFAGVGAPAELFPRARAAALRAVEFDRESSDARAALGTVYFLGDRDFPRAERELRQAVSLRPESAWPHDLLALLLAALGRRDEATAEAGRAVELAPANLTIRASAMEILFLARRYEEMLALGERTLELAPDLPQPRFQMGWAWAHLGEDDKAYASFRLGCRNLGIPEESLDRLDGVFAAQGLPGVYRSIARAIEQAGAVSRAHWGDLVAFHLGAGDTDRVFQILESAIDRGEPGLVWLRASPFVDGVRADPRFERMARRLGLPELPPG